MLFQFSFLAAPISLFLVHAILASPTVSSSASWRCQILPFYFYLWRRCATNEIIFVLVAPHIFCVIFKTKKSEICRETPELWSVTYIQTHKVTWLFFSAYAIISFALRARNYPY